MPSERVKQLFATPSEVTIEASFNPLTQKTEIKGGGRAASSWWGRVRMADRVSEKDRQKNRATLEVLCQTAEEVCEELYDNATSKQEARVRARQLVKEKLSLYCDGDYCISGSAKSIILRARSEELKRNQAYQRSASDDQASAIEISQLPCLDKRPSVEQGIQATKSSVLNIDNRVSTNDAFSDSYKKQRREEMLRSHKSSVGAAILLRIGNDNQADDSLYSDFSRFVGDLNMPVAPDSGVEESNEDAAIRKQLEIAAWLSCFESCAKLQFSEIAKKRFFSGNKRVVVTPNEALVAAHAPILQNPELQLVRKDNPSDPRKVTAKEREENRLTNLMLKAFILKKYGSLVILNLWAKGSFLDRLLEHGDALTQDAINEAINAAKEVQLRSACSGKRWMFSDKALPDARRESWHGRREIQNNRDFFRRIATYHKNSFPTSRIVLPDIDVSSIKDKDVAKRIENKLAIIGVMKALEAEEIQVPVCAYIWRKYFQSSFESGSQGISSWDVVRIFAEAKALKIARKSGWLDMNVTLEGGDYIDEEVTLEAADRYFELWLQKSDIDSYQLDEYCNWFDGNFSNDSIKTEKLFADEVIRRRNLVLSFSKYIALRYGAAHAREIWKTKLRDLFVMGRRLRDKEMLSIDKEVQTKSQNGLKEGEEKIERYIRDVLRDSFGNRRHLKIENRPGLMAKLASNFKAKACSRLWATGRALSDDEMERIAAQSCTDLGIDPEKFTSLDSVVARVRKANPSTFGAQNLSEQMVEYFKDIKDNQKAATGAWTVETLNTGLHFLRNTGNFGKYTFVSSNAPGETWQEQIVWWSKYYQMKILTPEERNAFFAQHPHVITSDPQFLGIFASYFGVLIEARTLWNAIQQEKSRVDSIEMLRARGQLAFKLLDIYEHMLEHHDKYSQAKLPRGVTLPSKVELEQIIAETKAECDLTLTKLKAKSPDEWGRYFDNSQRFRSVGNILSGLIAGTSAVVFVRGSSPNWFDNFIVGSEWAPRHQDFLVWGNLGLDGVGFVGLVFNGYATYREGRLFWRSYRARQRAKSVIEPAFHELLEKHKVNKEILAEKLKAQNMVAPPVELTSLSFSNRKDVAYLRALKREVDETAGRSEDPIFDTYLAYAQSKARIKGGSKVSADRLMTNDIKRDIAKSVIRAQTTEQHLVNAGFRGVGTLGSLACAASATVMLGAKGGSLGGAFFTPFMGPQMVPIGAVCGGFVAAAMGLISGVGSFIYSEGVGRYRRIRNNNRIQEWLNAYAHQEGKKWDVLIAGLLRAKNDELAVKARREGKPFVPIKRVGDLPPEEQNELYQRATEFAFRKLVRRDAREAMAVLAKNLQDEHQDQSGSGAKTFTTMLKVNFAPHEEKYAAKDQKKRSDNQAWNAYVDRLASLKDSSEIQNELLRVLVPS